MPESYVLSGVGTPSIRQTIKARSTTRTDDRRDDGGTRRKECCGGGYSSRTIDTPPTRHGKGYATMTRTRARGTIAIMLFLLSSLVATPIIANATTNDAYQLYDTRERDQQVIVNKVWDDGLIPDNREYVNGKQIQEYSDLLAMTIQINVPQASIRTYTITYDANGGSFGTEENGNDITSGTIPYDAKNRPYGRDLPPDVPKYPTPERTDGYSFVGWSTDKNAIEPDSSITLTNTLTDNWMNTRTDGSNTTLYAVWKDLRINYAVMAYGIEVDRATHGTILGITFGPALGYPEFSPYNGTDTADTSSTQTFTKFHTVSGDATVMSENATACTDTSHSVITGTDAGTDAMGNAYRCLHYDNWATILYWNGYDSHVYDKCIQNHCSKKLVIKPNAGTIANGIFSTNMSDSERGLVGDGQSYIMRSAWDNDWNVDVTKAGQGYAASLVRAKLIGADSHTKLDDRYAGVDALTRYTHDSSVLSCFPKILYDTNNHNHQPVEAKNLSYVHDASIGDGMSYDVISNDGVEDELWLFSVGELTNAVYPSLNFKGDVWDDAQRASGNWWWLRSPYSSDYARFVSNDGSLAYYVNVGNYYAVAPGFTLV